jgi:uncharacterized membrane protein
MSSSPVVCPNPPSPPDHAMAWIVVVCVAILLADAASRGHKQGQWRWVSTLVGGMIFGWFVEWANTGFGHGAGPAYCYPPADFPFNLGGVPTWVPIGWGGIIYAATWTARRLQLGVVPRAIAAAFLVASIDFSLDPVAKLLGFWVWEYKTVNFFGVPYDNFNGWYLIVFVYALSASFVLGKTRRLWDATDASYDVTKKRLGSIVEVLAPILCAAIAIGVMLLAEWAVSAVSGPSNSPDSGAGSAVIFMVLTALGMATLVFSKPRQSDLVAPNWPVILVPVAIPVASYVLFLAFAGMACEPTLVGTIPLQLLAGLFVYTMPWRRKRLALP